MEIVSERIKTLLLEKQDILNKYPGEDEGTQCVYAMASVRIDLELQFLNKLNEVMNKKTKPKEYILSAANWWDDGIKHVHQPVNIKIGFVITGQRHHNCIYTFSLIQKDVNREDTVKLMRTEVQGFLTNKNRFVTRKLAMKIALDAGQVTGRKVQNGIELFSEDLY